MASKIVIVGTHSVTITEGTFIACMARYQQHLNHGDRAATISMALYDNDHRCVLSHTRANVFPYEKTEDGRYLIVERDEGLAPRECLRQEHVTAKRKPPPSSFEQLDAACTGREARDGV